MKALSIPGVGCFGWDRVRTHLAGPASLVAQNHSHSESLLCLSHAHTAKSYLPRNKWPVFSFLAGCPRQG